MPSQWLDRIFGNESMDQWQGWVESRGQGSLGVLHLWVSGKLKLLLEAFA
jgi:hypothetical protein